MWLIQVVLGTFASMKNNEFGANHRIINDRMENGLKGSRIGYNVRWC